MDPVRIDVATPSRAYAVTIADDALDRIGPALDELGVPTRRFVVSSPLVWRLHGPRLSRSIDVNAPILVPDGDTRTCAELTAAEKNAISHRGRAFRALAAELSHLL